MFISTAILFIVVWAAYSIWAKLCDIERILNRIDAETSLSLQTIEERIDLVDSTLDRIDDNTDHSVRRL